MRPFVAVGCDIPLLGPMTGRSRPHLSLREGSEQAPFPLATPWDYAKGREPLKGSDAYYRLNEARF